MIMKLFAVYSYLQIKRVFKSFLRLLGILVLCILTTALVFGIVWHVLKAQGISLVRIGMVIPEEETTSRYVTDVISGTESIKSICSFEYCSYEEAKRGFENRELEAVVVLPQGFYHDVQVGLNPPAVIYLRENPTVAGKLFKELLIDATSYIGIAEAGVYSVLDITEEHTSIIPRDELGNTVALEYAKRILERDGLFRETRVNSQGITDSKNDMICSGVVIVLAYLGIGFSVMFGKENKAVLEKLKINGMGRLRCALSKILVMSVYIFVPGIITTAILTGGVFSTRLLAAMGLVSLTMAVYFEIIFETVADGRKGIFVLIIVNTIGIVCSGMIIPKAFLRELPLTLGRISPFGYWSDLLLNTIKGG